MRLIVGLGNPGRKYSKTRHNLGFMVIDELARRWGIGVDKSRFAGLFGTGRFGETPVGLLKPGTYMNNSGEAAGLAADYYRLTPSDVLVVLDDLALPLGQVRVRTTGSAGSHKGLIDILNRLGTDDVPRLRIGIGQPPELVDAVEYVIADFLPEEVAQAEAAICQAVDAIEVIQTHGYDRAMELFNRAKEQ